MTLFHDLWGSGDPRMRRLTPSARIVCGAIVFATCLVSPAHTLPGLILAGGILTGWVSLCGLQWKSIVGLSLYAVVLFLPLVLLSPWLATTAPSADTHWLQAARIPLEIGIRGTACIFICASTIAALDLAEFAAGLEALSVPRIVKHLILQIVHQTAMLTSETQRISAALHVRGLPCGNRPRLRLLSALPTIWLLRVMNRADRTAAAMEVRGFELSAGASCAKYSALDAFAVATASLLLNAMIAVRWLKVL